MVILLLILSILATVVCFVIAKKNDFESFGIGFFGCLGSIFGCIVSIILMLCFINCTDNVLSYKYIDEKIAMYQEENTKIEEQIDTLVQNYMKYESDTYGEFKGNDAITLVSLYPDLKSDELVQKQIEVYTTNNQKIKELKEQKIDIVKDKWWLYFGK